VRVAYSGGLDSSVLLHALAASAAARARGLAAIHVDHGLSGNSAKWAEHCRRCAAGLDVELAVRRVHVDRDAGLGLEAAARAARQAVYAELLPAGGILVTAHHQDDQAETVLLRLLRGAGVDGLAAMRPLRRFDKGWLARPLLGIDRATLADYATQKGIVGIDDPANADLAHDRNVLRHRIVPLLRERWPQASARIAGAATRLDAAARAQWRWLDLHLATWLGPDPRVLPEAALDGLDQAERGALFRHWCLSNDAPPPDAAALASIARAACRVRGDAETCVRWADVVLHRWRDAWWIEKAVSDLPDGWSAPWDGTAPLPLPNGAGRLRIAGSAAARAFVVRSRSGGERIATGPGRPRRRVKHLLQELAIPPWRRTIAPFLWCGDTVVAVGDWLLDPGFAAALAADGACLRWERE
jgi:tRNA(Ile)-lysidine synthase